MQIYLTFLCIYSSPRRRNGDTKKPLGLEDNIPLYTKSSSWRGCAKTKALGLWAVNRGTVIEKYAGKLMEEKTCLYRFISARPQGLW